MTHQADNHGYVDDGDEDPEEHALVEQQVGHFILLDLNIVAE